MTLARAIAILAGDVARRLLREGLVVRSLVWPGLLVTVTLAAVLGVVALVRSEPAVAVDDEAPAALVEALRADGLELVVVPDARAEVEQGRARVGTDGRTVWDRGGERAVRVEEVLRRELGAPWTPVRLDRPAPPVRADLPKLPDDAAARVIALLFSLYGLVFGLAGVARDRDGGILDAELCLPIPRWASGFARWLGTSAVLGGFLGLSIAMVAAVLPSGDPLPAVLHGAAATFASVAIGMAVVGQSGIKAGFSGPFGVAMTVLTGTASLGWRLDLPWLPVASLFSSRPGWTSLAVSLVAGCVGSVIYAKRSGGPP